MHGGPDRAGRRALADELSYFALKNSGRDCRQPERDDGLDPLG